MTVKRSHFCNAGSASNVAGGSVPDIGAGASGQIEDTAAGSPRKRRHFGALAPLQERSPSPVPAPVLADDISIGSGTSTPVRQTGASSLEAAGACFDRAGVLRRELGKPELAELGALITQEVGGDWAFTGSVALNLHSLQRRGRVARDSDDADVQIDRHRLAAFKLRMSEMGDSAPLLPPPKGDTHHRFGMLKVDLVSTESRTRTASSCRERIAGIPVLSLAELKRRKNLHCDGNDAKAQADIAVIDQLLALSPPWPKGPASS